MFCFASTYVFKYLQPKTNEIIDFIDNDDKHWLLTSNAFMSLAQRLPQHKQMELAAKLFANHNALAQLTNRITFSFLEDGPSTIELK